jgi:hypothetical protein
MHATVDLMNERGIDDMYTEILDSELHDDEPLVNITSSAPMSDSDVCKLRPIASSSSHAEAEEQIQSFVQSVVDIQTSDQRPPISEASPQCIRKIIEDDILYAYTFADKRPNTSVNVMSEPDTRSNVNNNTIRMSAASETRSTANDIGPYRAASPQDEFLQTSNRSAGAPQTLRHKSSLTASGTNICPRIAPGTNICPRFASGDIKTSKSALSEIYKLRDSVKFALEDEMDESKTDRFINTDIDGLPTKYLDEEISDDIDAYNANKAHANRAYRMLSANKDIKVQMYTSRLDELIRRIKNIVKTLRSEKHTVFEYTYRDKLGSIAPQIFTYDIINIHIVNTNVNIFGSNIEINVTTKNNEQIYNVRFNSVNKRLFSAFNELSDILKSLSLEHVERTEITRANTIKYATWATLFGISIMLIIIWITILRYYDQSFISPLILLQLCGCILLGCVTLALILAAAYFVSRGRISYLFLKMIDLTGSDILLTERIKNDLHLLTNLNYKFKINSEDLQCFVTYIRSLSARLNITYTHSGDTSAQYQMRGSKCEFRCNCMPGSCRCAPKYLYRDHQFNNTSNCYIKLDIMNKSLLADNYQVALAVVGNIESRPDVFIWNISNTNQLNLLLTHIATAIRMRAKLKFIR